MKRTGSTVAIVPRVGFVNPDAEKEQRDKQEATTRLINAEPITFAEKSKKWKAATGQCEVAFWSVRSRVRR